MSDVMATLVKNNEELVKQLAQANRQVDQLHQEITYLNELIAEMNRKLFGKSKEVIPDQDGQLSLFNNGNEPATPAQDEPVIEVKNYRRKAKGTKADKLAKFPVEQIEKELLISERDCQHCGVEMTDMGSIPIRSELAFIPAKITRLIYNQHSYVCKHCEQQGITSIKK